MTESISATRTNTLKDLGINPHDHQWVEELATSLKEKRWFQFQRETGFTFGDAWEDAISSFNAQFKENIEVNTAIIMTKRWKRLLMGSWFTLASHNPNKVDWKESARRFERYHREIEERMNKWSEKHEGNFPSVITKQPVLFWHGPYFNECIERVPHLFTDVKCSYIKTDIALRVVSFDAQTRYIRLDFTKDIRAIIKQNEHSNVKPWHIHMADYSIRIMPTEIETHLNILGNPLD